MHIAMKIEFLKDNPGYTNEMANLMFKEWGHLTENSRVDRYLDLLSKCCNNDKIPLAIVAKSEEGNLIGFACLVKHDMEINRDLSPWISCVFVVPEHRRKGYGTLIVDKIEQIAGKLGFKNIYLFTFDKEEFYLKLSWEKVKNDFYMKSQVTVMMKDLA